MCANVIYQDKTTYPFYQQCFNEREKECYVVQPVKVSDFFNSFTKYHFKVSVVPACFSIKA